MLHNSGQATSLPRIATLIEQINPDEGTAEQAHRRAAMLVFLLAKQTYFTTGNATPLIRLLENRLSPEDIEDLRVMYDTQQPAKADRFSCPTRCNTNNGQYQLPQLERLSTT